MGGRWGWGAELFRLIQDQLLIGVRAPLTTPMPLPRTSLLGGESAPVTAPQVPSQLCPHSHLPPAAANLTLSSTCPALPAAGWASKTASAWAAPSGGRAPPSSTWHLHQCPLRRVVSRWVRPAVPPRCRRAGASTTAPASGPL